MLKVMTKEECVKECAETASILFHRKGWTWVDIGVPCYEDIKKTLTELFRDLQKTNDSIVSVSLGRLRLEKQEGGGVRVYLNIGVINSEKGGFLPPQILNE